SSSWPRSCGTSRCGTARRASRRARSRCTSRRRRSSRPSSCTRRTCPRTTRSSGWRVCSPARIRRRSARPPSGRRPPRQQLPRLPLPHSLSTWAVLVAAGRGERLGEDRPKAFARLGGLPLLAEPLRRLDASDWIDGIVLVAPPEWEEPAILAAEEIGASKVASCVTGGETRSASVRAGLAEIPEDAAAVLVHDAARP